MTSNNHDLISKGLGLLKLGLGPFVEREISQSIKSGNLSQSHIQSFVDDPIASKKAITDWDASLLIKIMWDTWNDVFKKTLGFSERSLVSEIRDWRNKWAHQEEFSNDDTDRALDSIERLLSSVSATKQADDVRQIKLDLRLQSANTSSKSSNNSKLNLETQVNSNLKPWRDVITPHKDVASGMYQLAEFAADLWQVNLGEGSLEYKNPNEFFKRTYLTQSLNKLLNNAIQRIAGSGGDPVIQLQTNFGGGKTHSMLTLFHLFSGKNLDEIKDVKELLKANSITKLPKTNIAVLVGNKISPGNPTIKKDGTVVNTLWGEMAYQLGGKEAYEKIRLDDERATSPGDKLREIFNEYGPCLILIDEWVAYARQLNDDLPGGGFETQFSFAQALTESAKLAKNCLLVISLPASDTSGSPHTHGNDEEVGGQKGQEALLRLRNVVGRLESSWTPATAQEGFEIVKRRLFEPITTENNKYLEATSKEFAEMYITQQNEFPTECAQHDYESRIKMAYPIHPEIFDRLYTDWSTLIKFQRTRGVLRLMASVVNSLWESGDKNPLILPANIPLDDIKVKDELTRYLSDNWKPIIEKDIDGSDSLPISIDREATNLGKLSATRRVARTVFLGSAPITNAANKGLDDRHVKLGCVMPGESTAIFGDALRRLSLRATYLYQDGTRYWYDTQPTVTKVAEDRAKEFLRNEERIIEDLEKRIRVDLNEKGDFLKIHIFPTNNSDVPDEKETRLVVFNADTPFVKGENNPAEIKAQTYLEFRGNSPRKYRNTLVFLVPDSQRLAELNESIAKYLAWKSIVTDKDILNLTPHQVRQAETQLNSANLSVLAKIPETYLWLLVPNQKSLNEKIDWQSIKLSTQDQLATRVCKKLKADELLLTSYAPTSLKMDLDKIPLWRGDSVTIEQLEDDFSKYLYLPRLSSPEVLRKSIEQGLTLIQWEKDSFGYADSFNEKENRYVGLRAGELIKIIEGNKGLIVKPGLAFNQLNSGKLKDPEISNTTSTAKPISSTAKKYTRFHGTVSLDSVRMGKSAGNIAEEIVAHLGALLNSDVKVTLEIEANIPDGIPDNIIRTVTENAKSLKFDTQGFEEE
jgi:predicted AAA+ superfamily ATPase